MDALYFFVKGREEMQRKHNVGPLLSPGKSLQGGAGNLYVNFTDWNLFMISYIVNLFMVQTDLKRNDGNSESFKKKKTWWKRLFVYVCIFPINSKDCFHVIIRDISALSRSLTHSYVDIVRLLQARRDWHH